MKPRLLLCEPCDFPPDALRELAEVFDVISGVGGREDLLRQAGRAEALFVRLAYQIDQEVMNSAPRLRVIASATTGLNHIDLAAAGQRGIEVLSLRGQTEFLRTITVTAELTWGLLVALIRQIPWAFEHVKGGGWDRLAFRGPQLAGRTLGILGFGRLGGMVAEYGRAFGMQVLAHDPARREMPPWVERVDSEALYRRSDVLSIHASSTPRTRGLVDRQALALMRPGAVLINTSRGDIVDEEALAEAIESGRLAGAALDVLQDEHLPPDKAPGSAKLRRLACETRRVLITPHIGGASTEAMARAEGFVAQALIRFWKDCRG